MPDGLKISQLPQLDGFADAVNANAMFPVAMGTQGNARLGAADINWFIEQKVLNALNGGAEQEDLNQRLGNYVPLAGGTMTGELKTPRVTGTGGPLQIGSNNADGSILINGNTYIKDSSGEMRLAVENDDCTWRGRLGGTFAGPSAGYVKTDASGTMSRAMPIPAFDVQGRPATEYIDTSGEVSGRPCLVTWQMQANSVLTIRSSKFREGDLLFVRLVPAPNSASPFFTSYIKVIKDDGTTSNLSLGCIGFDACFLFAKQSGGWMLPLLRFNNTVALNV